jgi:predicted nucleotidyltransferase
MNRLYNKILTHRSIPRPFGIMIVIVINWIFQGILYTKRTETIFKILFEIFIFLPICFLLTLLSDLSFLVVIISLFLSHTINWLVNNNLFSLFKTFGFIHTSDKKISEYIENLTAESQHNPSLMWVGLFGSFSKDAGTTSSDIDIRIVRFPGVTKAFTANVFIQRQRLWANSHKFPLDIYLLDNMSELNYMVENAIEIKKIGNGK